ncbi:MAG TPA: aconitate hydratase AcnA, partial [Gemmatimonadetes bacterium]|nr:aconitate hydratase AcnA [Gemmatimonadota bacterium]
MRDPFGALTNIDLPEGETSFYKLSRLQEDGIIDTLDRLPFSIRILLENALRHAGGSYVSQDQVLSVANWSPVNSGSALPFMPTRVVLQDFTGVPAVVDLAAMRDGIRELGGDPSRINPVVPADLVIDHSVQVDHFGFQEAFRLNVEKEFERNRERYALLRWAQEAFDNFSVVPPGTGIVHQVNLEYLASVIHRREHDGSFLAYPDTLVGTDSHTTMVNGLGVVGWGVGGIEAEAVVLGQPYYMLLPEVVGMKLTGTLPDGATATDLVLCVTEMLREHGVVGRFVEYYGAGLSNLTLPDMATLANMAPEYGATIGFFPVDDSTIQYLRGTGRDEAMIARVETITKELGIFRTDDTPDPEFTSALELDLSTVEPSLAGPKRPQDRISMVDMGRQFKKDLPALVPSGHDLTGERKVKVAGDDSTVEISDGTVVIASITSCTNTSNPSVMVGAGLLAKKAVEKGLTVKPWVKTAMAPGSQVVTDYLTESGLLPYLEELRFHIVGYGCMTCIGNSGPLPEHIHAAVEENGLVVSSVLSGNRNFEARIHPLVRANYLASPGLVVAYALAGRMDLDLESEPLGMGSDGQPVYLRDIWPSPSEVSETVARSLKAEMFTRRYSVVTTGDENWQALPLPEESNLYEWDTDSTYVRRPPFFEGMSMDVPASEDIEGARVLALMGQSVTTDHISPAGAIPKAEPAGLYLRDHEVTVKDFNTFGSRRGNHEVMMRGTFANIRIKNEML